MQKTTQHAEELSLSEIVKLVTGGTWEQLAGQLDGGFVPTLMALPGRGRRTARRNELTVELANRLELHGYQVWRGSK